MKRILGSALIVGAMAVALTAPSYGACAEPIALAQFGTWLNCADFLADRAGGAPTPVPVSAFAWQVTAPGVNTGPVKIACEAAGDGTCATGGEFADGIVTIESDWSTTGVVGCPVVAGVNPRIAVSVTGADGKSIILSVTADSLGVHTLDLAHPDDGQFNGIPLSCDDVDGKVRVNNIASDGTNYNASLVFSKPKVYTDCDPGSVGFNLGNCTDGFVPTVAFGNVYWIHQPCAGRINPVAASWTNTLTTPDAAGNANVLIPIPTAPDVCAYVGAASRLNSTIDSSAVTTSIRLAGASAAADRAVQVAALRSQGKVTIGFRTESELEAVSFDIIANGRVVNSAPIIARGGNGLGAIYEGIVLRLGDFRNARSLAVRTNLRSGSITSDPVSF